MNNSTPTPKKITLEDIAQRKQEVLQEICDQKQAMADTTRRIFAPLAPAASGCFFNIFFGRVRELYGSFS